MTWIVSMISVQSIGYLQLTYYDWDNRNNKRKRLLWRIRFDGHCGCLKTDWKKFIFREEARREKEGWSKFFLYILVFDYERKNSTLKNSFILLVVKVLHNLIWTFLQFSWLGFNNYINYFLNWQKKPFTLGFLFQLHDECPENYVTRLMLLI